MDLAAIDNTRLDGLWKGIPPGEPPFPLRDLGQKGWNVLRGDLPLPVAVLKDAALRHNGQWMRQFLALTGAKLCPHGKTTMSPQLFARQLADGAWGITLATIQHVRVARQFGVQRILLANQLVSRPAIRYVADELDRDADLDFLCLVDSLAGVAVLCDELAKRRSTRPLGVLVEVGVAGKRTGCRDLAQVLEVARAVQATPCLALRGVEGFEGVISDPDPQQAADQVRQFLDRMLQAAAECARQRLFAPGPVILTAGGSVYFDLVAGVFSAEVPIEELEVLIRSGCYLTHDSAVLDRMYRQLLLRSPAARRLGAGLRPALEIWSHVQSRPEPTRAVLSFGKRDASHDAELPVPLAWFRPGNMDRPQPLDGHRVASLNDQHALLDVPAESPLEVGDMVACGISHPCTTFDRWPLLMVVDDDYGVTGGVRTFF